MRTNTLRYSLFILLFASMLACQTISGIPNKVREVKETVGVVATIAKELSTQGAPLVETVQAIATDSPDLKETLEGLATENLEIVNTIEAIATEGFDIGEAPADIPLVDKSTITNFFGMKDLVSYTTTQDFQTVVDFYKAQMPISGWTEDTSTTYESQDTVSLGYTKDNNLAIVVISNQVSENLVLVAVTIVPK